MGVCVGDLMGLLLAFFWTADENGVCVTVGWNRLFILAALLVVYVRARPCYLAGGESLMCLLPAWFVRADPSSKVMFCSR